MINKYSIIIFCLLLIITSGKIFEDSLLIKEKIVLDIKTFPKSIKYKIPLLKQKIHIDISSNNSICKTGIEENNIKLNFFKNFIPINIFEINQLNYDEIITIEIISDKYIGSNCKIILEIIDPYGNMEKTLISIILPFLLIFYLVFKISWVFIAEKLRTSN